LRGISILLTLFMSMSTVSAQNNSGSSVSPPKPYRVGPGDLLQISVWEVDDWDGQYRIDTDGKLQLPLLGEVGVQDQTLVEVRKSIVEGLQKGGFVQNPNVFIDLVEAFYKPIRVTGAVRRPGKLSPFSHSLYLLDALAEAGGLLDTATDRIVILSGNENYETIDYSKLIEQGIGNKMLEPGDTVAVPASQPMVISVLGEVNRQGQMVFSGQIEVTILRVIAAAGGFTDYARENRVTIHRKGKDRPLEVDVRKIRTGENDDLPLQHDDLVIVGSSRF